MKNDQKNLQDYLANENPFCFLKDYDKNAFKCHKIKSKLDAAQKLQPKFIPCAIGADVLEKEHNKAMNAAIIHGLYSKIREGCKILEDFGVDTSEFIIENNGDMVDEHVEYSKLYELGYDKNAIKCVKYNLKRIDEILAIFKEHSELDNMKKIILDVLRLKLLDKQKILRNKIYEAIKDELLDDNIQVDFDMEMDENPITEAENYLKFSRNSESKEC